MASGRDKHVDRRPRVRGLGAISSERSSQEEMATGQSPREGPELMWTNRVTVHTPAPPNVNTPDTKLHCRWLDHS